MTGEDKDQTTTESYTSDEPSNRGFAADQMVACDGCLRANPPTRTSCIYCGVKLPFNEAHAALRRPTLKPLEEWEQGFSVVLPANESGDCSAEAIREASTLLRLESERMKEIVESGVSLPVARAASDEEAELIVGRLRALGITTEVCADEALAVTTHPPRRARALEFNHEALTCWTNSDGAPVRVPWAELLLFVSGRVFTKKVEVEERRKRMGGGGDIVEARELTADEAVLDFFPARDDLRFGWRIAAESFDYSCLGERKALLARENFLALSRVLRERADAAVFDEGYMRVRHLLTAAWPLSERTEAQGLRRGRGGRLNTEAVTVVSNEAQFTRYSRLHWRLALRGLKG